MSVSGAVKDGLLPNISGTGFIAILVFMFIMTAAARGTLVYYVSIAKAKK